MLLSRIKKRFRFIVWVVIGLVSIAPIGHHASGAVLCIAKDGHLHAERSDGFVCDGQASTTVEDGHAEHTVDGSCFDLPLPSGGDSDCASYLIKDTTSTSASAVPMATLSGASALVRPELSPGLTRNILEQSSTLDFLREIVLQI